MLKPEVESEPIEEHYNTNEQGCLNGRGVGCIRWHERAAAKYYTYANAVGYFIPGEWRDVMSFRNGGFVL